MYIVALTPVTITWDVTWSNDATTPTPETTTGTPTSSPSSSGVNGGAIGGGVTAAVVVLCVLTGIFCFTCKCCYCYKKHRSGESIIQYLCVLQDKWSLSMLLFIMCSLHLRVENVRFFVDANLLLALLTKNCKKFLKCNIFWHLCWIFTFTKTRS